MDEETRHALELEAATTAGASPSCLHCWHWTRVRATMTTAGVVPQPEVCCHCGLITQGSRTILPQAHGRYLPHEY